MDTQNTNTPTSPAAPAAPAAPAPQPAAPTYPAPAYIPQPPAPDYGAELLAELRALRGETNATRAPIEAMPGHIAKHIAEAFTVDDDEEERETSASVMNTPASQDSTAGEKIADPVVGPRSASNDDMTEPDRHGIPKPRNGEKRKSYIARLRRLPPVGRERPTFIENPSQFSARRFDGTTKS